MYRTYEINDWDTWDTLEDTFHISREDIGILNGIDELVSGNVIVIPNQMNYKKYKVKKGDSLYKIASDNNTTVEILELLNGINSKEYLYPDQELIIPLPNVNVYIPKVGDTIYSITNKLKISVEELMKNNKNIYLYPDQLLFYKNRKF